MAADAIDSGMDLENLYLEETITDRKMGTIRRMTPVDRSSQPDSSRQTLYVGQAQIMTPMGALPLHFDIEAITLVDAVNGFAAAAQKAAGEAIDELKQAQRDAASSIVVPGSGDFGGSTGSIPGSGKIQIP